MKVIKFVGLGFLFLQMYSASAAQNVPIPEKVTIVCNDGTVPDVSVSLLRDSFGYFDAYFRHWGRFSNAKIKVDAPKEDFEKLLHPASLFSCSSEEIRSIEALARFLSLRGEGLKQLKTNLKVFWQNTR